MQMHLNLMWVNCDILNPRLVMQTQPNSWVDEITLPQKNKSAKC